MQELTLGRKKDLEKILKGAFSIVLNHQSSTACSFYTSRPLQPALKLYSGDSRAARLLVIVATTNCPVLIASEIFVPRQLPLGASKSFT